MPPQRLRMAGVRKAFGATIALKDVSLDLAPGEVHALIGENGAGKSTLMKILSGASAPDAGTIELDGEHYEPHHPLHARRCGVAMIYQELNLAPHLTVAENILLGAEPSVCGWLNRTALHEIAASALRELGHAIPLDMPVQRCTIAEQQVVEIARALIGQPKVLIMDEPTSSLTQVDTQNLFKLIRRLSERGVSIIYISHFLEECQEICHRYTVLRDGQTVGSGEMREARLADIIHMMVGREMTDAYPKTPHRIGDPVLELREVRGAAKPISVTLTLRAGEILGVAGLIGAGRTETLRALFGLDRIKGGVVEVNGLNRTHASPASRLSQGIGLLSENRKEEGLMLNRSLADNLVATRYASVSTLGFINNGEQEIVTRRWMDQLSVRAHGPWQSIGELSGGNQQKIAIGRLLHHEAAIFLLDEPTRGIDVGSKSHVYRLVGELAAQGKAIIFVSSYLPELLGICDTIAVMCRGVLTAARPASEWTEHTLIGAAIGQECAA